MRRIGFIAGVLIAAAAVLGTGSASGGDGGPYEVRAVFDNAAFLVKGEDVRIAGARVGVVSEVTVSGTDETVSLEDGGRAIPGKAVVVMTIEDPGFQDWRADASCIIRPQSLLGEKFVECTPTQSQSASVAPPPPLEEIPDGQPGAGEHLLPVENNGKAVDIDLVANIQRLPFAQRFRLILNELGIGLAARGEELEAIVERANPALRQTDRVLAILARQNRVLAQLATDGDAILAPLARHREDVSGFIANAGEAAAAAAEERAELESGLELFPGALREIRATMRELEVFSDEATPVLASLGDAAPSLLRASLALRPFAASATRALTSLGTAAEAAGPKIAEADPILVDLRDLALASRPAGVGLDELLSSLNESGGYQHLMDFLFYSVGSINGFDQYGHFLRALLIITNCNDYEVVPIGGCEANFSSALTSSASSAEPTVPDAEPTVPDTDASEALTDFLFEDGDGK
jgi:ABC-type transporter Mla subunit MlaD